MRERCAPGVIRVFVEPPSQPRLKPAGCSVSKGLLRKAGSRAGGGRLRILPRARAPGGPASVFGSSRRRKKAPCNRQGVSIVLSMPWARSPSRQKQESAGRNACQEARSGTGLRRWFAATAMYVVIARARRSPRGCTHVEKLATRREPRDLVGIRRALPKPPDRNWEGQKAQSRQGNASEGVEHGHSTGEAAETKQVETAVVPASTSLCGGLVTAIPTRDGF